MPSLSGLLIGGVLAAVESTRTKAQADPFPADRKTDGWTDIVKFGIKDQFSNCYTYRLFTVTISNKPNTIKIDGRRHERELNEANVTTFCKKRGREATEYTLFKRDEKDPGWCEVAGDDKKAISHPSGIDFRSLTPVIMLLLNQLVSNENLPVLEVDLSDGSIEKFYWLGGNDWQSAEPKWSQRAPIGMNNLWAARHDGAWGVRMKVRVTKGTAMKKLKAAIP